MRIEPNHSARVRDIRSASRASESSSTARPGQSAGEVESVQLTGLASWLAQLANVPPERAELTTNVRQRLSESFYDSPSTIQSAAEQLAADLDWLAGLPLSQIDTLSR